MYIPAVTSMAPGTGRAGRLERQLALRSLVVTRSISSQHELVALLRDLGFEVTQATVSRDISDLGLVKVSRAGRHVYASPEELGTRRPGIDDQRLRRALADYPIRIGRSGLTLLLVSEAGVANAIGQAIDESSLDEQEGTLAGDDTLLVLFANEQRLEAWLERFEALRATVATRGAWA
jgi:transcriptional regulator of arginine metabolism